MQAYPWKQSTTLFKNLNSIGLSLIFKLAFHGYCKVNVIIFTSQSRILRLYYDVIIGNDGLQILGTHGLWAGRDLYRALPAATRGLGFCVVSTEGPSQFCCVLRHARGTKGLSNRDPYGIQSKSSISKNKRPMGHIAHLRNKHVWVKL